MRDGRALSTNAKPFLATTTAPIGATFTSEADAARNAQVQVLVSSGAQAAKKSRSFSVPYSNQSTMIENTKLPTPLARCSPLYAIAA